MTHAEFEKLTGKQVPADFYRLVVEPAYMESTYSDKQTFAADWNTANKAAIIRNLTERIKAQNIVIEKQRFDKEDMGYFLADQAEAASNSALRAKAIELLGEKEYITHKIRNGYNLWEADRKLLLDILD